jgi:hypothetical protein
MVAKHLNAITHTLLLQSQQSQMNFIMMVLHHGGAGYLDRKGNYKHQINPTADIRIVETTLVDGKTYRNFQPTYIDRNGQVKVGV